MGIFAPRPGKRKTDERPRVGCEILSILGKHGQMKFQLELVIYMCICIIYIHICIYIYICIYITVCMYVCMYVCMNVC